MSSPYILEGLHERPFFLRPECHDILIYPAEWLGEIALDPSLTQELSDIFYHRTYGRFSVYNLWTLFVRQAYVHWFEDDVALGYRNLLTDAIPDEMPNIFYNEAFSLLQLTKLKELRTELEVFRKTVDDYTAIPLVPAALAITSVSRFELGEGKDPLQVTSLLKDLKEFLA